MKDKFKLTGIILGKTYRLGRKITDKTRPLLIPLPDISTKRQLLKLSKTLKDSEAWNNIFISPDLTPMEREEGKKLKDELRRRRNEGEDVNIRRGKIVTSTNQHRVDNGQH